MKNRINILALGLLMAGGLAMSSCTKNDDSTIVLIGTEYYIDDILSVIPDTLQTRFFADFGSIPNGSVPPKVEGSYIVAPKQRVSSNVPDWPPQTVEPNVYMRFSDQHNGIVKMELNEATDTMTDTVFVCGSGHTFAVYFIENKIFEMSINNQVYSARMKRGVVMKGEVTDAGLSNFRYATVVMETEDGSNGIIGLSDIGSYFIYKDGDGLAKKEDW